MPYFIPLIRLCSAAVFLALTVIIGVNSFKSPISPSEYDRLIVEAAQRQGIPPRYIKAIIRKESKFRHWQVGSKDEIGLMQITDDAVTDWENRHGMQCPRRGLLFDPRLNIEIGTWYFANAFRQWLDKSNEPVVMALAQYNAGRSRALEWISEDNDENVMDNISFPGTKNYIKDVLIFADEYGR